MEASILSITRRLGVYGPVVLLARGWIEELPRTAPKQPRRFLLRQPLPHEQQFEGMLREHYTRPVLVLISSAFDDLAVLGDEMGAWYNSSPERLLPAARLETIGGIAHLLAELRQPLIQPLLTEDPSFRRLLVFVAPELGTSRTVRHANAIRSLEGVVRALRDEYCQTVSNPGLHLAAEGLADELEELIAPLIGIRYPTRYS